MSLKWQQPPTAECLKEAPVPTLLHLMLPFILPSKTFDPTFAMSLLINSYPNNIHLLTLWSSTRRSSPPLKSQVVALLYFTTNKSLTPTDSLSSHGSPPQRRQPLPSSQSYRTAQETRPSRRHITATRCPSRLVSLPARTAINTNTN